MNLINLKLSIRSINTLQKIGVYHLQDVMYKMTNDPVDITLALASIRKDDFTEITAALRGLRTEEELS